jgi:uncharacterized protein YcbX
MPRVEALWRYPVKSLLGETCSPMAGRRAATIWK